MATMIPPSYHLDPDDEIEVKVRRHDVGHRMALRISARHVGLGSIHGTPDQLREIAEKLLAALDAEGEPKL